MPTPTGPRDSLMRGKPTLVNPTRLQEPHANNYGQMVNAGALGTGTGFVQGSGTPMGTNNPLRRWTKIGHLSQGQGGAQKVTPGILGPRAGFR